MPRAIGRPVFVDGLHGLDAVETRRRLALVMAACRAASIEAGGDRGLDAILRRVEGDLLFSARMAVGELAEALAEHEAERAPPKPKPPPEPVTAVGSLRPSPAPAENLAMTTHQPGDFYSWARATTRHGAAATATPSPATSSSSPASTGAVTAGRSPASSIPTPSMSATRPPASGSHRQPCRALPPPRLGARPCPHLRFVPPSSTPVPEPAMPRAYAPPPERRTLPAPTSAFGAHEHRLNPQEEDDRVPVPPGGRAHITCDLDDLDFEQAVIIGLERTPGAGTRAPGPPRPARRPHEIQLYAGLKASGLAGLQARIRPHLRISHPWQAQAAELMGRLHAEETYWWKASGRGQA